MAALSFLRPSFFMIVLVPVTAALKLTMMSTANDSRHNFSFVCNSSVTETCALDQTNRATVTLLRHEIAIVVALRIKTLGDRFMKVLVATDAWPPQVNGVVRTLKSLERAAAKLGVTIDFLSPDGFRSFPVPTYPGLRLAIPSRRRISARIEESKP